MSDAFKSLEGRTPFDDILDEYKEDKIRLAVDDLMAKSLSRLEPNPSSKLKLEGEIELNLSLPHTSELQKEIMKKYQ